MINFHDFVFQNKEKLKNNSIDFFVKDLSKKTKLVYFDEFQITNIVDAMILGKLFKKIFEENIKVIFSSNIKINDLYKDGLQREQFIPFIKILKNNCYQNKLSINELGSLLSNPISQLIFDYSNEEKIEFLSMLDKCGFHRGIDSQDRHGEYKNSLDWCLERIILGLIYEEESFSREHNIKPINYKNNFLDLHKWINIIHEIKTYIKSLNGNLKYVTWIERIKDILNNWKKINNDLIEEINNINEILDKFNSKSELL